MKEQIKPILISVLVGFIAFPTITLGSTLVSSLIQGKTVEEAIQILAIQIDSLIGRVETLETKQEIQEQIAQEIRVSFEREQAKQEAHNAFRRAYDKVWLKGHTEEDTIRDTRFYCQQGIEEGNQGKVGSFCPLAEELERTWEVYQEFFR